jgi:tyrosyl-tRNA synthetase
LAQSAQENFDRIFKSRGVPDELEEVSITARTSIHLPAFLAQHFSMSRNQARQLLGQQGGKLNGQALSLDQLDFSSEDLQGVLQIGKRRWKKIILDQG